MFNPIIRNKYVNKWKYLLWKYSYDIQQVLILILLMAFFIAIGVFLGVTFFPTSIK